MSSTIYPRAEMQVRDVLEHIERVRPLFEIPEMVLDDMEPFQQSVSTISRFLESDNFEEMEIIFHTEKEETEKIIRQLKLLRIAFLQGTDIGKILEGFRELPVLNFVEILAASCEKSLKNPYEKWLDDESNLLDELKILYESDELQPEHVRRFERAFRRLFRAEIHVKFTVRNRNIFEMTPVLYWDGEFIEMPHPLTGRRWIVSGFQDSANNGLFEGIRPGDILNVSYRSPAAKHKQFYKNFISLDYETSTRLDRTLQQVLHHHLGEINTGEAYRTLGIQPGKEDVLVNQLVKAVITEVPKFQIAVNQKKQELKELQNEQAELDKQVQEQKQSLSNRRRAWADVLERIDYPLEAEEKPSNAALYDPKTFIDDLQSLLYHLDDNQLLYEHSVLELFMSGLRANVLTILSGPSGTGKSSLVEGLGKAIVNAKVTMIPVQSSWTDAQDLIGYFHPNEKIFIATPFMEALAAARLAEKNGKDELHIICLDEMNLAHIEYYFAQFLSVREQAEPKIQLYPKRYEKWAMRVQAGELEASRNEQENADELLTYYPSSFPLPSNVRFVGTLNMDHTVKSLSPKVIDRSLMIELLPMKETGARELAQRLEEKKEMAERIHISLEELLTSRAKRRVADGLNKISSVFQEYRDIPLNNRGRKHVDAIASYWWEESVDLIDLLIKGKMLPRIELKKADMEELRGALDELLKNYPKSKEKVADMLKTNHTVSFW
ncbi:AAA family ATPase [Sporosarcina sp. FSL W7-1349]|uniref:AAA family ATPase n=1 Tax=Sporosarcina sp. FSL W7-1349 TaxID=2921561 RepID=UPI0030F5F20C